MATIARDAALVCVLRCWFDAVDDGLCDVTKQTQTGMYIEIVSNTRNWISNPEV